MTGRDLVSGALRLIGALAAGDSLDAQEATDGLAAINRMIDSWSTSNLFVFALTEETPITLTGGTGSYTLGAGGNITTRPMAIEKAAIRANGTDYPVRMLSLDEYVALSSKSVSSAYPEALYDDGGYPQRTLKLYPVPSVGNSLILWTRRPLTTIATLDTALSLPPGYERALVYNSAIELAPEYGKQVPEAVAEIALQSIAAIKRANQRPNYLRCDSGVVGPGHFNINTGGYTR